MKKIFTLLFTAAMITSAFAQYDPKEEWNKNNKDDVYGREEKHRHDKDNGWLKEGYYFTPGQRDMQIAQINREYEYRIEAVKNKFYMSWYQKRRQIGFLKDQRDNDIRMVYARFNDRRNKYYDRDRWNRKDW